MHVPNAPRLAVVLALGVAGVVAVILWVQHYIDAEVERRAQVTIAERQRQVEALPVCEEPPTLEEEIAEARQRLEAFGHTTISPLLLRSEASHLRFESQRNQPLIPTPCRSPNVPVR